MPLSVLEPFKILLNLMFLTSPLFDTWYSENPLTYAHVSVFTGCALCSVAGSSTSSVSSI
jgi:hypothetical protein